MSKACSCVCICKDACWCKCAPPLGYGDVIIRCNHTMESSSECKGQCLCKGGKACICECVCNISEPCTAIGNEFCNACIRCAQRKGAHAGYFNTIMFIKSSYTQQCNYDEAFLKSYILGSRIALFYKGKCNISRYTFDNGITVLNLT